MGESWNWKGLMGLEFGKEKESKGELNVELWGRGSVVDLGEVERWYQCCGEMKRWDFWTE